MKGEVVGANGHLNPEASVSRTIDRRRRRAARTMVGLALVSSVVMTTYSPIDTAFAATTFTVNSAIDAVDTNPGDGACSTGAGSCSLRAAIQEANALSGPDTINVTAGVYSLSIFGAAEDLGVTGDLDITGPLTIVGSGAGSTIIDAVGNDRVLHLTETAGNVSISGVTLRGGVTEDDGAGIYRVSAGTLNLNAVTVTGNTTGVGRRRHPQRDRRAVGQRRQRHLRQRGPQRRRCLQRRRAEPDRRTEPGDHHRFLDHRQHCSRGRRRWCLERPRGLPHPHRRHGDRQRRQRRWRRHQHRLEVEPHDHRGNGLRQHRPRRGWRRRHRHRARRADLRHDLHRQRSRGVAAERSRPAGATSRSRTRRSPATPLPARVARSTSTTSARWRSPTR